MILETALIQGNMKVFLFRRAMRRVIFPPDDGSRYPTHFAKGAKWMGHLRFISWFEPDRRGIIQNS